MDDRVCRSPILDSVFSWSAAAIALGLALSRAASSAEWRGDLPAVRDLGLVSVGFGGAVSTIATQAFAFLPLGSRTFRASLVSAIALAIAVKVLFSLVRQALASFSPSPRLASTLAWIATLTAALSPTWQRESTVGGGASIAVALALGALSLGLRVEAPTVCDATTWLGLGALAGATFAESPPAALAVALALGAARLARRTMTSAQHGTPPRLPRLALAVGLIVAVLLSTPVVLRPPAPRGFADVGRVLSSSSLAALDVPGTRTTALAAWIQEIGIVSLFVAGAGAAFGIARKSTRVVVAPFLAIVALDTLVPARALGLLTADAWSAIRALAIASITATSALGVHEVVAALLRARIPMAKSAAVLTVVFHLTLVALTSEEAGYAADRSEQTGAEAWTDEALERLPPSSAILVRSPALAWRLWAARLTRGERPDVVVVPIALLDRGAIAASLISKRHELEPLLRSYALTGEPSEFALSKLADIHPLRVELDRSWSKRVVSHLNVDGLWLEFASQPLGPSDRKRGNALALVPVRRLLATLAASSVPDPPTAALMVETLRAGASVMSTLGDFGAADQYLERVGELANSDPLVLTRALPYARKGLRRMTARRDKDKDEAPKKKK